MKAVVTGGGGFLGRAIVAELLARGHMVTSVGRTAQPELVALGVRTFELDLTDRDGLRAAMRGAEVVFHCAAKAGVWGAASEYRRVNIDGTRTVIAAAEGEKVPRLVYTSTPSVCFDGRDQVRASNDLPYASSFLCAYPRTKAQAERDVLAANGRYGFATTALRPHLIFGPRDPHLLPRLVARARDRKLVRIGDGSNEVTLTFVENAALAHVLAAEALTPDAPHAGRAYFVGQEQPVKLWAWIDELLAALELPPIERRLSLSAARALGLGAECVWKLLGRTGEPPLTRFVAAQLGTSHSYDMAPARRDFGYRERVDNSDALARTIAWFRNSNDV